MAEKPMSSRLMQMKFMQQAAASSASSRSSPTNGPPSKRQRLTNGHSNPRHSTSDLEAMREAVAAEDAKRLRAIERHAAELGETRWRLSVREVVPKKPTGLEVQTAGFADLDTPGSDEDEYQDQPLKEKASLRMTYGKREKPKSSTGSAESSSDDSDESEYDPLGVEDLIEKGRTAADTSNNSQHGARHIGIRSISSGAATLKCYRCGGPHKIANCPSRP